MTGVWCDYEVIKGVKQGNPELILESLHSDTEYQYSDEGLTEMCESMEYEFTEEGDLV